MQNQFLNLSTTIALSVFLFFSVLVLESCKKETESDPKTPSGSSCNRPTHSGFTTVLADTCGDGAIDGTRLEYKYVPASDSIYFLGTFQSLTAGQSQALGSILAFRIPGMANNLIEPGGLPGSYSKLATLWLSGTAPSSYTGTNLISDGSNSLNNKISVYVNLADKTILLGLKRQDLVTDAAFGSGSSLKVSVAWAVGDVNITDQLFSATAEFTIAKNTTGTPPVVTTSPVANITITSVTGGGTISSDGGQPILERGLCWSSTNVNPTISDDKLAASTVGTGDFSFTITGLQGGKQYFLRAYAKNARGIAYGSPAVSFTTSPALLPGIVGKPVSTVTENSFTAEGINLQENGSPILQKGICYSTNPNPDVSGTKTNQGGGTADFSAVVNSLPSATRYYIRAYATNQVGTSYGAQYVINTSILYQTKVYKTVTIGNQVWMAQNLRTDFTNDNAWISSAVPDQSQSSYPGGSWLTHSSNSPLKVWYLNDNGPNGDANGLLYNFKVIESGKLCPVGWHVATDNDFQVLTATIGGQSQGGKLKAISSLWNSPNTNATNETGFSAIGAGNINGSGRSVNRGLQAVFKTSTPNPSDPLRSIHYYLDHNSGFFGRTDNTYKADACSVRCIKD